MFSLQHTAKTRQTNMEEMYNPLREMKITILFSQETF